MTAKDGIEAIKKLLFGEVPPVAPVVPAPAPPAPVEKMATDYTLADGVTVVSIDKLEVGGTVTIAGTPAPDATIVLADGTSITTVAGLITEVIPATEPVEEPVETAPAMMAAEVELRSLIKANEESFAACKARLDKYELAFAKLLPLVEAMAAAEIEKPIEAPKDFSKMTALEKYRAAKN